MELQAERRLFTNAPWGLLGAVLLISLVGVYNLASASRMSGSSTWASQAAYVVFGLVAAGVVAWVDHRLLQRMVVPVYLANTAALVALKFFGHVAKGAESWFVVGPLRIEPAEFMKLGMVLMLAKYFHDDYRPQEPSYGFLRLLAPLAIAVVPTVLVLAQPDLGTALMMAFTTVTVLLFARPKWTVLVGFGLVAAVSLGVLWNDYVRVQDEPRWTLLRQKLKPHQDKRISGWLAPTTDLRGSNYHAMQSKIAVGSGGVAGKGWKQGTQTGLRFLPEQHTDFIFSVFAEEQGYVKCLGLLALYAALLVAALGVALKSKDRFGAFTAVGVAAMLFWQIFENIGMVSGLMPITGITLPLMSYGGSSVLSVMLGIGLLVNISLRRPSFSA